MIQWMVWALGMGWGVWVSVAWYREHSRKELGLGRRSQMSPEIWPRSRVHKR